MSELLLDTCAFIWLANGDQLTARARQSIATAQLSVSPITAWEIGGLLRKGRLAVSEPLEKWFQRAIERMDASVPVLTPEILMASQALPGNPPADPADRMVIATAREHGLIAVTRDTAILRYGEEGHLHVLEC